MGRPPSTAGTTHESAADPLPDVAETLVGALGTSPGSTAFEAGDSNPLPRAFLAATANVYSVPLVSPAMLNMVAVPTSIGVCGTPEMDGTIVYPMIGEPPSDDGGDQDTSADPSWATATTSLGAVGTVAGITEFESVDCGPVPIAFTAATRNVYVVPFVKPVAAIDVAAVGVSKPGWATPLTRGVTV